jgi:mono/diheme cytochrome c family protein
MKSWILSIVALLLLALPVFASGYTYDQATGYYYSASGAAFTRSCVWTYGTPGYYYCGRWYAGTPGYYTCTYYPVAPKVDVTASYDSQVSQLIAIADYRHKAETQMRKRAFETLQLQTLARELGISGAMPPYLPGIGIAMGEAYGTPAVSGNTQYGSSFQQRVEYYGQLAPSEYMAQSDRQTERAQIFGDKSREGHQALVAQALAGGERAAIIREKSYATKEILAAIEGTGTRIETRAFQWKTMPGAMGGLKVERRDDQVPQVVRADLAAQWQAAANEDCASCHGTEAKNERARKVFALESYRAMDMKAKTAVWEVLVHPDDGKRMPRTEDGKAGPRMTRERLSLWLVN